jgi:outer membrane protein assembly factor BamA
MASIDGFYRVALGGEHLFGKCNSRLIYDAGVASLPIRFCGLGYEAATSSLRTRYTHLIANGTATYLHHIAAGLHLGAGVDLRYGKVDNFEPLAEEYLHRAGQNTLSTFTTGLSLTARYDRRDNSYNPTRGIYLSLTGEVRPKALGSYNQTLWHVTAQANLYQSLWQGAVAALDLYGDAWSSATPWFYWPMMGGQSRMRGYYYGRFTNSKMATAQLELRHEVWGPIGVVAWGGAGTVFSSLKTFDWGEILPTYGVGLRLKAGDRTALRIDYGLGRRCSGIIINVNEAF